MKKLRFLVPALVLAGVVVFTGCSDTENKGRDVSGGGAIQTLEGTLAYDDSEWYLDTEDSRYALHLGNRDFQESKGTALKDGSRAEVRGFVDGDEIAAVSVHSDRGGDGRNREDSADGEGKSYGRGNADAQDEGARGRGRGGEEEEERGKGSEGRGRPA